MFKSKYIVIGLGVFALLVAFSQLQHCAGPTSPPTPSTAHPAPAPASTAANPVPVEPPPDVQRGYAERRVVGQDQFGQWATLSSGTVQRDALDATVQAPEKGTVGKRRTEFAAWIKTDQPTSVVLLHAVGYTSTVRVQIDDWHSSSLRHSNAWTTDPSMGRYVVTLGPGWHKVILSVTRQRGYVDGPVSVRLQLGSAGLDPTVPTPWAVPDDASPTPATTSSTPTPIPPAPSSTSSAPATAQTVVTSYAD